MVKNNKTAIKGLLVLGGVSTAAASVYTLSKKYAKKLLYRHHKQEDSQNIYIKNDQDIQLRGILIPKENPQMTVLISHPFGLQAKDMQLYVPYFEDHLPEAQILLLDACAH